MSDRAPLVLLRGGGDLASGVAARLYRSGIGVIIVELPQPRAIRRLVSFAEAVYAGAVEVEGIQGVYAEEVEAARRAVGAGRIAVVADAEASLRHSLRPVAIVDARMRKRPPELDLDAAPLIVGLGPGFTAGVDCHAVVETQRGHHLGRVLWEGAAEPDSGQPGEIAGQADRRVLRAPEDGIMRAVAALGSLVAAGQTVTKVGRREVTAPFDGAVRGLIHDGLTVRRGEKIGDLDPRNQLRYCHEISDKALAVGGGVLEAVLTRPEIRRVLRG
jgi:xanthine dehydrogenase accessory factor